MDYAAEIAELDQAIKLELAMADTIPTEHECDEGSQS